MSINNLSADGEFRYVIQWFNEWSGLQREDFIPVLMECLNEDAGPVFVNGIGSTGVAGARPMSLFQCRIKLFREWTPKWPAELRYKLRDTLFEIDSKIGEKIEHNNIKVPEDKPSDLIPEIAVPEPTDITHGEKNSLASLISVETDNASNDAMKITDNELVNNIGLEPDVNIPQAQEHAAFDMQTSNNSEADLVI